jgi:hypothetical protein
MLTAAFLSLCLAQVLVLARYWMRVTVRDHDASSLRRIRNGLDWEGDGHRRRKKPARVFLAMRRR